MRATSFALVCALAAGCGGGCSGGAPNAAAEDELAGAEGSDGEGSGAEAVAPPVDPGPPPVVRLVGEPDAHSREVLIRVENRGDASTELGRTVRVERQTDGGWDAVDVELSLRYSCEDEAMECVTLAPGATYLPPPWLGTIGQAQCECERCAAAEPGTYRFVLQSCNGAHVVEGESFELVAPD